GHSALRVRSARRRLGAARKPRQTPCESEPEAQARDNATARQTRFGLSVGGSFHGIASVAPAIDRTLDNHRFNECSGLVGSITGVAEYPKRYEPPIFKYCVCGSA